MANYLTPKDVPSLDQVGFKSKPELKQAETNYLTIKEIRGQGSFVPQEEPLTEYERLLAQTSPTLLGAYKAVEAVGKAFLHMVPYGKYALPSERDRLFALSEEDQRSALLWDAAGAVLDVYLYSGRAFKDIGKFSRLVGGKFVKKPRVLPDIEAAKELRRIAPNLNSEPFMYRQAAMDTFLKQGMHPEEAIAITKVIQGADDVILGDAVASVVRRGRKTSAAFNKSTNWIIGQENIRKLNTKVGLKFSETNPSDQGVYQGRI